MKNDGNTREELLDQLVEMRRRITELETALDHSDKTETTCVVDSHLFHLFFENAPVGYQCLDGHGRIMKVNREWTSLLGYTEEEAFGTSFDDYVAPGQEDAGLTPVLFTKAEARTRGLELDMVKKDGFRDHRVDGVHESEETSRPDRGSYSVSCAMSRKRDASTELSNAPKESGNIPLMRFPTWWRF